MNILICDDLPEEATAISRLLNSSGFPVNITVFHNAADVLAFFRAGALAELCFLDIIMPDMSGIQLADMLRQEGYKGKIVFLSTSKDYGPETYTVDAFSYLIKPPTADAIGRILKKLQEEQIKEDHAGIKVRSAKSTKILLYHDISYVEAMLHKIYFHMTDGSQVHISATFSEISAKLLGDPRFIQCHRSYVVNMQDIAEFSEREIFTHSGGQIPIPRNYRDIRNKFYTWKFGVDSW